MINKIFEICKNINKEKKRDYELRISGTIHFK